MEFSDILYNNDKVAASLSRALGDDGILVSQVGEDAFLNDVGTYFSDHKFEQKFMNHLRNNGFKAAKEYSEAHGGFHGVWHYMIFFKERKTLSNWYANEAEINLKIRRRSLEVTNGLETPFRYFDGATMMGYQFPSRINEEVFCRDMPQPAFCEEQHGFDPSKGNAPISAFEVKQSLTREGEQGLFTRQQLLEGDYIAIEEKVNVILSPTFTTAIIRLLNSRVDNDYLKSLNAYLSEYGHEHDFYGKYSVSVESNLMNFLNHCCNDMTNSGVSTSKSDVSSDANGMQTSRDYAAIESLFYNPFVDRNHLLLLQAIETASRNVNLGEELLSSDLSYHTDKQSRSASYRDSVA